MQSWADVLGPSVPLLEIFVRGTILYLAIFVLMRVAGKRQGGVHSLTDLLVVVLVAEAASAGLIGEGTAIVDSTLLVATILFWSVTIDVVAYHVPALRPLLLSKPTPLVRNGVINDRALRRQYMDRDELISELRLHGITDVSDVARAYLEPNGMISVIQRGGGDGEDEDAADPPRVRG